MQALMARHALRSEAGAVAEDWEGRRHREGLSSFWPHKERRLLECWLDRAHFRREVRALEVLLPVSVRGLQRSAYVASRSWTPTHHYRRRFDVMARSTSYRRVLVSAG